MGPPTEGGLSPGSHGKLKPRADGPFKVISRIDENAYNIIMPSDYGVSTPFNMSDFSPYLGENCDMNSRTSLHQPGENEAEIYENSSKNNMLAYSLMLSENCQDAENCVNYE